MAGEEPSIKISPRRENVKIRRENEILRFFWNTEPPYLTMRSLTEEPDGR